MKSKKLITLLSSGGILIFAVILMFIFLEMKKDPAKKKPVIPVRNVRVLTVNYENAKTSFRASGRVNSKEEIVLSPEVGGKMIEGEIPFKKGQSFKKGDLLIKIYDDEAQLQLKAKKSTFLKMSAGVLPDFKLSFPESYPKWMKFFENLDLEEDFPELPDISSTQEKVFLASKGLLSDYYSIKSDELRLKKHYIRAPFTGAITEVSMEVGSFVNTGARIGKLINTEILEVV